jgi:hypothetical protein
MTTTSIITTTTPPEENRSPFDRLADLILEGCQYTEPLQGHFIKLEVDTIYACTITAAYMAEHPHMSFEVVYDNLVGMNDHYIFVDDLGIDTNVEYDIPATEGWEKDRATVIQGIIHLTDTCGWSRERVANEWVRTLKDQ